jgi:hypothetical protein
MTTGGEQIGPDRFKIASLLQLLAPLSWGFGSWLLFLGLDIKGSACLSCFLGVGAEIVTSPIAIAQTAVGAFLFFMGIMLFIFSLGMIASRNDVKAQKWFRWLGRWRPRWQTEGYQIIRPDKYRPSALVILLGVFVGAVLVIPGIGEDRQFVLNQFFNLWGTVFYFYAMALLLASIVLIYYRRPGGYILSLIVSIVAIGFDVPDLFGLLPPSPPTFRTSIILLGDVLLAIPLAYGSWKAIRAAIGENT